ncbi:DNA alkylation repair protein [Pseudoduganella sp. FT93W]|uniref:DNA alkylation repair protein n=1 Tax=Duganella fentianensis TaxID=2692177 RepID=A0A845HWE9_9BURK|nr:DNA alkylation repair protein [Duganella fentianensis]MYN45724.1 DNA alkylation repair protein [Duganella fentianensis]
MTTDTLITLRTTLLAAAEAEHAPAMRAYMRDQFEFLGVRTPQRRAACKPVLATLKGQPASALLELAGALWQQPEREFQYVAIDLLALHWKQLDDSHLPALLQLVQQRSWWDSVDGLAGVIGDVLRYQHAGMDDAIAHQNLWVRRIALLHQLGWRGRTDCERLFRYALQCAHEQEFFIQKAIGWALRDYARHDPQAVHRFTSEHQQQLAPLSYREARKHL